MNSARFLPALVLASTTVAFAAAGQSATARTDLTGEWILTTVTFGYERSERLNLVEEKGKLTGWVYRRGKRMPLTGRSSAEIRFEIAQGEGSKASYVGKRTGGDTLAGTATATSADQWFEEPPVNWRARRAADEKQRPREARTLDFTPVEFHRVFSASIPPVLTVWPGDTVRTKTVDAAGVDEQTKSRVLGGNPQTGPFFVEGAMPGDVLVIRIRKLGLNRAMAISDDGLVERALTADYVSTHKDNKFNDVIWKLDAQAGVAKLAKPTPRLKDLAVPTRPMLGCVGVAPGFSSAPIGTGDSGRIGGNMDFNEIREGTTVYLPVSQPGALLYVGDGHALQGDGELNGNALETSLDVEFTVDVERERSLSGPRVENSEDLMAMGLGGSLDEAFRRATSALAEWIEKDYSLTGPEAAILLGATIQYQISEVADRNVGVVAKVRKQFLPRPETKKP